MTAKEIKDAEAGEAIERMRALVVSESGFPAGTVTGRMDCSKPNLSHLDDLDKVVERQLDRIIRDR